MLCPSCVRGVLSGMRGGGGGCWWWGGRVRLVLTMVMPGSMIRVGRQGVRATAVGMGGMCPRCRPRGV